jgi:hypothetical protein
MVGRGQRLGHKSFLPGFDVSPYGDSHMAQKLIDTIFKLVEFEAKNSLKE